MPWGDLNKRQQTYLQAVYEVDQATEASVKQAGAHGYRDLYPNVHALEPEDKQ